MDHAAIDPVAAETAIVVAMPIDHRALVTPKRLPLPQQPAQSQPRAVRHDVKNVPAPTDHLVNVPNRVLRAAKIAANADHVGPIALLLPLPRKQQMSFHRESMMLLSPVQQPNDRNEPNEPNELSEHAHPLSLAADRPERHDHRRKTSMNSSATCSKKQTKSKKLLKPPPPARQTLPLVMKNPVAADAVDDEVAAHDVKRVLPKVAMQKKLLKPATTTKSRPTTKPNP